MKTLLCPIYLSTNALSGDRLSIGLIMANNDVLFFNYSEKKLSKIKHLFSENAYSVIKLYLKSLYKNFNTNDNEVLFSKKDFLRDWVNESYLSYLEKYTNNLVQFSKVVKVNVELTEDIFKKFFEMYVSSYPIQTNTTKRIDILHKPQTIAFYENVEKMVNLDKVILNTEIEDLLIDTKVNFIGKNNVPTAGNILNLDINIQSIENSISRFVSLTKALDSNQSKKGVYYIVGEEPDKNLKQNHNLWQQLQHTKILNYIELKEIERVKEYFIEHNVEPYFQ